VKAVGTEVAPSREASRASADSPGVSVVIPAFNEESGIGRVLTGLRESLARTGWAHEIIVVDDGSSDGTARVARDSGVTVVSHGANRGYGASLKSGILAARAPLILIIDADGTYPIDAIPRLLESAGDHDMVVGARTGAKVEGPLLRRPARWFLRRLAAYLAETEIPDLNSGLRVFRRDKALQFFPILPSGFSFTTSITLALLCNDGRVAYIPIDYAKRTGRSKIRPIRDMFNFILLIVRSILYFNPLKIFIPASLVVLAACGASLYYDLFILRDLTEKTLILLFAGVQLLAIGVLADMISKSARMGPLS
jgi:glycosyltransferase involved in cell wall biosynthesis